MLPELIELNRIRLEDDCSYNTLADEIGFKDTSTLHKLMNGKSRPTDRTLYKIRKFLDARKRRTRKAS